MNKVINISFAIIVSTIVTGLTIELIALLVILAFADAGFTKSLRALMSPIMVEIVFALIYKLIVPVTFLLLPAVASLTIKHYRLRMIALILVGALGGGLLTGFPLHPFIMLVGGIVGCMAGLAFSTALSWREARDGNS